MEYTNIERRLGLHEEIDIVYVVDGFQAIMYIEDFNKSIESDIKKTVREALESLELKLSLKEDMSPKEDKNNS